MLVLLAPAGAVSWVMTAVQAASEYSAPVLELVETAIIVAAANGTAFPVASCCCGLSTKEQAPALTVRSGVKKANCTGGPALKVAAWVAVISPLACALSITAPACGSA